MKKYKLKRLNNKLSENYYTFVRDTETLYIFEEITIRKAEVKCLVSEPIEMRISRMTGNKSKNCIESAQIEPYNLGIYSCKSQKLKRINFIFSATNHLGWVISGNFTDKYGRYKTTSKNAVIDEPFYNMFFSIPVMKFKIKINEDF